MASGTTEQRLLYVSHFLSAFGDRMWQFAVPLLFMDIWTETLLPSAATGFAVSGSCVLLMPYVGSIIDRSSSRLATMRWAIIGEAVCITLAAALFWPFVNSIHDGASAPILSSVSDISLVGIILLSVGAELTMRGGTLSLERDWAVVIAGAVAGAEGKSARQTQINSTMRTIDLGCKLLGPAAFGFVAQYAGAHYGDTGVAARAARIHVSVGTIAVWNLFFVPIEYFTLRILYGRVPELQFKGSGHEHPLCSEDAMGSPRRGLAVSLCGPATGAFAHTHPPVSFTAEEHERLRLGQVVEKRSGPPTSHSHGMPAQTTATDYGATAELGSDSGVQQHSHLFYFKRDSRTETVKQVAPPRPGFCQTLVKGWSGYWNHSLFFALLGFCLLWATVLDNGTLMTAYLKWRGVPEGWLGLSRGLGAIMGIIGTRSFPKLLNRLGQNSPDSAVSQCALANAGHLSIWSFWMMLIPIGVVFQLQTSATIEAWVMLGSVTISRFALWSFDMAIQQLMQERIAEQERGSLSGTHTALCNLMLVLIGIFGMVFSDPYQFPYLVFTSLTMVFVACVCYAMWYRSQKGPTVMYACCPPEEDKASRYDVL
eukprot:TRINITY_DN9863_c0_g1_i1.p1 TRINITY_DN9863_c0_g1~~TRINITY_DN9863_c0_g1_i1.p1  ORF type:complete len:596 (+),score=120.11 TRINITY_DN9863_c0_g1_i1:101-1888(+)